jgi:hypothetical protein
MKVRFFRSPDADETGIDTEVKANSEEEDPRGLVPAETSWLSRDAGQTIENDPTHDVPYDFCIHIVNSGTKNSGQFIVQFLLGGDLSQEFRTGAIDGIAPGEKVLVRVPYGSFENKTGIFSLQATVYTIDGTAINSDAVYNFTINAD